MRSYAGPSATTAAKTPVAARRGRRQRCVARGDGRPRSVTKRHVPARERSPPSEHTLASETRDGRATRAPAADIPPARLLLRRSHARGSDTLDARQQSESDATSPAAAAAAVANRFGLGDSPRPRSCKWLKKSSKILKKQLSSQPKRCSGTFHQSKIATSQCHLALPDRRSPRRQFFLPSLSTAAV